MKKIKKKNIEISVLLSIYEASEKEITRSINSILNQTFKNFELIIILDFKENKKIEKQINNFKIKDNRIKILKNKDNRGLAYSLNRGIKNSIGEYIARMDVDDFSKKERLEKQLSYIKKNKQIDFVFTWARYFGEKGKIIKYHNPSNKYCDNLKKNIFKKHLFVHPTLLARTKILKKEKYDENFRRAQDYELWVRLSNRYKFAILEEYLLDYSYLNKNQYEKTKDNIAKNYYGLMAHFKNFKKHTFNFTFYIRTISLFIGILLSYIKLAVISLVKNGK
jgi:glycosyltransferase involved in cell wall biosynthesis